MRGEERPLKKSRLIFDTGPLLLYFAEDKRVKDMLDGISAGTAEGYTCDTSLAELYYKTCETFGREVADLRYASIRNSMITVLTTDGRLTRTAGGLKCAHRGKLALADAYIIAVAQSLKGTLVTTDHLIEELKLVETRLLQIP
jgi:predicted nucleic acid-binding protein